MTNSGLVVRHDVSTVLTPLIVMISGVTEVQIFLSCYTGVMVMISGLVSKQLMSALMIGSMVIFSGLT